MRTIILLCAVALTASGCTMFKKKDKPAEPAGIEATLTPAEETPATPAPAN